VSTDTKEVLQICVLHDRPFLKDLSCRHRVTHSLVRVIDWANNLVEVISSTDIFYIQYFKTVF
jgi:hypothetical protein